jgi:LmbE family N-acetylglucosaminyl deacetylase
MVNKILIVGAHPDDETFGMGGTIAKHSANGDLINVLILTDGSSSQYKDYQIMIEKKKKEAQKAMDILGVRDIQFGILPDMKLDTVPHIQINKVIEDKIDDFQPDFVYTHHWGDINKDHRLVFESTMVATRPISASSVKNIYCYEIPSSTEWQSMNISYRFNPNNYTDISNYLQIKINAVRCYESEIRPYPHPRSSEAIEINDKSNGTIFGKEAAERFVLIREIV